MGKCTTSLWFLCLAQLANVLSRHVTYLVACHHVPFPPSPQTLHTLCHYSVMILPMLSSFVQFGSLSLFPHSTLNKKPWCAIWVAWWECSWLHFPPGGTFDVSDTSHRFTGLLLVSLSIAFRWVSILKFLYNMVSAVTVLSASDLAYDWRLWSNVPVIFLCCHPLMTLGCPTPTAVMGLQCSEPCSEAFATDMHIAGILPGLVWASLCHPLSHRPRPDIFMFLTHLLSYVHNLHLATEINNLS